MSEMMIVALAEIAAANARVIGMKAENDQRISVGQSVAYTEKDFAVEARYLEHIAEAWRK